MSIALFEDFTKGDISGYIETKTHIMGSSFYIRFCHWKSNI